MKNDLPTNFPLSPRPDQDDAASNVVRAFESVSRCTVLSACGTGKTLIGTEVARRLDARSCVIFVPTLALLAQTVRAWTRQAPAIAARILCVCSDETVLPDDDHFITDIGNLDWPVTTDPQAVRQFIEQRQDRCVVFATYASSATLAGGMPDSFTFDLGVIDEAHRTAGADEKAFALCLRDGAIRIARRLFMTATMRTIRVRNIDREDVAANSMDDEAVYGPVVYRMPIAEAVNRGLICDYRIVVSLVEDKLATTQETAIASLIANGNSVDRRGVLGLLGLRKLAHEKGLRRAFTYHARVRDADAFAQLANNLPTGPSEIKMRGLHVHGRMIGAERDRIFKEFNAEESALMSNCQCLTEGVDAPEVDIVAFLSPRSSFIDIVQASGRALRRSAVRDKPFGYLFLPVCLPAGALESVDQILETSAMQPVWNALRAMAEQDDALMERIVNWRHRSVAGLSVDDPFGERLQINAGGLMLERLRAGIVLRFVERITTSWDDSYGALLRFQANHGHLQVSPSYRCPSGVPLHGWIRNQRLLYNAGTIDKRRLELLERIGFVWRHYEELWNQRFSEFVEWQTSLTPDRSGKMSQQLRWWLRAQRRARMDGSLPPAREQALIEAGVIWTPNDAEYRWSSFIGCLHKFRVVSPNGPLTHAGWLPDGSATVVGRYSYFRTMAIQGRLSAQQLAELRSLGLDPLRSDDEQWDVMFRRAEEYLQEHGDLRIPYSDPELKSVATWLVRQRQRIARGVEKQPDRLQRLARLGVTCGPSYEERWDEQIREIKALAEVQGNFSFARNSRPANFVHACRLQKEKGTLSEGRVAQLDSIGFPWRIRTRQPAHELLERFIAFKVATGRAYVAAPCDDKMLLKWARGIRSRMKKRPFRSKFVDQLDAAGFLWIEPTVEGAGTQGGGA